MRSKILLGVTGGIGSGKTLVCRFLEQMGCSIYHADHIAKQLYKKNAFLKKKLIRTFGNGVLNSKNNVSLLELRKIVFSTKSNQQRVGKIVHPFVISEVMKSIKNNKSRFIAIESALIFETNFDRYLNYTVLVYSDIKKRIQRIAKRDKFLEKDIRMIIKLQMPEKEKIKRADFVIPNNGSINELKKNVKVLFESL